MTSKNLEIGCSENETEYHVFITDPYRQYNYAVDFASHQGDKIKFKKDVKTYFYKVTPKATKSRSADGGDCSENSFKECVQKNLEDIFLPVLSCIPPWMSDEKQCKETLTNSTIYEYMTNSTRFDFILNIYELQFICDF